MVPEARDHRPAQVQPVALRRLAELVGADNNGVDDNDDIVAVTGVSLDSRAIRTGDLYAALPGAHTHGARFIEQARDLGAVAVLTDAHGAEVARAAGLPVLCVPNPRAVIGAISAEVYAHPDRGLLMLGITGTNGKTTTAYLLESALRAAGHRTGLIGTVEIRIGDERLDSARTTPEAPALHAMLAMMRERGITAVAMEVSSHALVMGRVDGVVFDVVGFTNLSRDHLDFHGDLESYFQAKATLFTPARARAGVVCADDRHGARLARLLEDRQDLPCTTVGRTTDPGRGWRLEAVEAEGSAGHLAATVLPPRSHPSAQARQPIRLRSPLAGDFNLSNAALALAMSAAAGVAPAVAADGIAACPGVPGRMERVAGGDDAPAAIVDYAHTPEAISTVLTSLRGSAGGRLLVVLGAGGDRDRAKRPLMGRAAAEHAEVVIVTDDNPRSESPEAIRAAVREGAEAGAQNRNVAVLEIADRAAAISAAVREAHAEDIVIVVGKGHEQGQEVSGVMHPFDDRAAVAAALEVHGSEPA